MTAYPELEIGLHRFDAEAWTVDLRFNDPESDGFDSRETTTELVDFQQLRELHGDDEAYGMVLGQALLADPAIRERFARARAVAQARGLPLRVRLFFGQGCPRAATVAVGDPQGASGARSPIDRRAPVVLPVPCQRRGSVRAVPAPSRAARPCRDRQSLRPRRSTGWRPLTSTPSCNAPGRGLATSPARSCREQGRPTLADITAHLREGYDILYLVCHGAMRAGEARLWLEDETGHTQRLPGQELADRLRELSRRPRLVVLASCQSAGDGAEYCPGRRRRWPGSGRNWPERASQPWWRCRAMSASARSMPSCRGSSKSSSVDGQIDRAMTVARAAVCDLNRPDWWMPVLFLALKSGRIWYEPGFERVGAPGQEMEKWPALLRSIEEEHCTPILGPGLVESLVGSRQEIAMRWASDLPLPHGPVRPSEPSPSSPVSGGPPDPEFVRDELQKHLRDYMVQQHGDNLPEEIHKIAGGAASSRRQASPRTRSVRAAQGPGRVALQNLRYCRPEQPSG